MGVPPTDPPYITDEDPADSEIGIAKDKILFFRLRDDGNNLASFQIWIDEGEGETLVYDSDSPGFQAPYDGAGSSVTEESVGDYNDVHVYIQKTSNWGPLADVTVHVEATDGIDLLDVSWTFTIEEYDLQTILVIERTWPGKLHRSRANHAPWTALGRRHLDDEDLE